MYKNTTNNPIEQHKKKIFSLPEPVFGKKIMVDYKAQRWKYEQRVIAKIEVGAKGTNIRFVVTKNKNNSPETIYKSFCKRSEMELSTTMASSP